MEHLEYLFTKFVQHNGELFHDIVYEDIINNRRKALISYSKHLIRYIQDELAKPKPENKSTKKPI